MRVKRVTCTGPLWVLIAIVAVSLQESSPNSCDKCYYAIYTGNVQTTVLRFHTNLNPECVDLSQLQTCVEDGKTYWLFENEGTHKQKLLGGFPTREKWLCTDKKAGNKLIKGLDLIREKEIKGMIKPGVETKLTNEKNLVLDLVERISHEFNVSNCWI